jgi:hypothetical protein
MFALCDSYSTEAFIADCQQNEVGEFGGLGGLKAALGILDHPNSAQDLRG